MEASQKRHPQVPAGWPQAGSKRSLEAIIKDLTAEHKHGRAVSYSDRILALRELCDRGWMPSLQPLLPVLLNLDGAPYTLDNHYPFAPLFRALMPKQILFKTGRQVSKSTSLSSHG